MNEIEKGLSAFMGMFCIMFAIMGIVSWNIHSNREALKNKQLELTSEKNLTSSVFKGNAISIEYLRSGRKNRTITEVKEEVGEWLLTFKGDIELRGFKREWYYSNGERCDFATDNLFKIWKRLEWERVDNE